MSESIEIATQGETASAVESVPQPATDTAPDTGQEQQAEPAEQTETQDEPKRKPWFQQRIDELTREKHEARRQAEQYAAYLRQIQQGQQPVQQQEGQPPPGYVPASEIGRIAAQQLEQSRFNDACNEVADFGASKFRDFDQAVANFQSIGGAPPALLEAVTALGKEQGAQVFYELGMNPDEAMRLARLSPARMAVEVTKMANKPSAPRPVSKLPPPITPIAAARAEAGGQPNATRDPAGYREWFRKQLASR